MVTLRFVFVTTLFALLCVIVLFETYSRNYVKVGWSSSDLSRNTGWTNTKLDDVIIRMINERDVRGIKQLILEYSEKNSSTSGAPGLVSDENKHRNTSRTGENSKRTPLLTLFTTFNPSSKKKPIFINTFRIWNLLQPEVQPVLYCPDTTCEQTWKPYVTQYNWTLHVASKCSKSDNIPLLKYMFLDTMAKYNSTFYAYSNGDILYDESLVQTITFLRKFSDLGERLLIVGQRSNYKIDPQKVDEFIGLKSVTEAMAQTKLFSPWGEDYFIYNRKAVDWSEMPEIVVGRRGYDNWLVWHGLKKNLAVVDATKTLSALHQTGSDGNHAGHQHKNANYNMKILKRFDASLGLTSCPVMETKHTEDGDVTAVIRTGCEKLLAKHKLKPKTLNL